MFEFTIGWVRSVVRAFGSQLSRQGMQGTAHLLNHSLTILLLLIRPAFLSSSLSFHPLSFLYHLCSIFLFLLLIHRLLLFLHFSPVYEYQVWQVNLLTCAVRVGIIDWPTRKGKFSTSLLWYFSSHFYTSLCFYFPPIDGVARNAFNSSCLCLRTCRNVRLARVMDRLALHL